MDAEAGTEAAIDELYAIPPTGFVAQRDQLVSRARADGDRALAARIKALRRPSVGAWYLNTAARDGLTSLRELLRLGSRLREAQAGGDFAALRDLAAQRGPLVSRVVRDLTAHLAQLGTTATAAGMDEVRATLASALADPELAEQLLAGRLDRAHQYSGFGFGGGAIQPTPEEAEPTEPAAVAVEPAEPAPDPAELKAARDEVELSQADLAAAAADLDAAGSAAGRARATVERLTADLAAATAELAAGESALGEAESAHQLSVARSKAAQQRLDALTLGAG